ncbi:hypothetical protein ACSQ6I_23195 [Anabaena sp. WFMT]|uniref:hypothetical protein n=1 Tax=Anabaena sp. WFMT TaxID=3449730 RepID=UPI003F222109
MTKPNFPEATKHNEQKSYWPVWFPYPSSWFRAAILVPIALPGARLIFWGFTGVILSVIGNKPLLFIFSVLFGLLIPTIFLAFIYHLFWFIWKKQESYKRLPKWIPHSNSLWEGFYATIVIGISFILILTMFSELAFLDCESSYQISASSCAGRMTGRAAKSVFTSIEINNFINKPWFTIWILITVYLYQAEHLFKKRLIPKLRLAIKHYQNKRQPKTYSVDTTDIELDRLRGDMGLTEVKKGKLRYQKIVPLSKKPQRNNLFSKKKIVFFSFILLVTIGILFFPKLLNFQQNNQFIPIASQIQLPSKTEALTPDISPHSDNFREAVNQAINAANLTQLIKSQNDWKTVANEWQKSIDMMKSVPVSSPNYAVAQKKILEYQQNLNYAYKNANSSK